METIAERIIKVSDLKSRNMSEFARSLKLTPSYISKLKRFPESIPSERTIKDICRIYGINEQWLLTGEGPMNQPLEREKEIADIAFVLYKDEKKPKMLYDLINVISKLDVSEIEILHNIAKEWIDLEK